MAQKHPSWDQIEKAAIGEHRSDFDSRPLQQEIDLSAAISAKRQADALEKIAKDMSSIRESGLIACLHLSRLSAAWGKEISAHEPQS